MGRRLACESRRTGSPPVLLLAAPRAAMLADVERDLSYLEALPLEPRYVDVAAKLRPQEIQRVVRNVWFPHIRSCYETLLSRVPDARGKLIADFVIELGRKRTTADTSRIGLGDTEHVLQLLRPDAHAGRRLTGDAIAGCDERICAVIDVEQRGLRAFEQQALAGANHRIHFAGDVGHHRLQSIGELQRFVQRLLKIDWRRLEVIAQHEIVIVEHFAELGGETFAGK